MQHVILESGSKLEECQLTDDCSSGTGKGNPNRLSLFPSATRTRVGRMLDGIPPKKTNDFNPSNTASIPDGLGRTFPPIRLFKFSAAHKKGVKMQMSALAEYLRAQPSPDSENKETLLLDMEYTLSERRSRLEWRAAITASTVEELIEAMESFESEVMGASKSPGVAFVFTGQGSQWPAMGRELMQYPAFATIMIECEGYLKGLGAPWLLLGIISQMIDVPRVG